MSQELLINSIEISPIAQVQGVSTDTNLQTTEEVPQPTTLETTNSNRYFSWGS